MVKLPKYLSGVAHERRATNKREPLFMPNTPRNESVVVLSGIVGAYAMNSRGDRSFVALHFPGELALPDPRGRFGLWPLVNGEVAIVGDSDPEAILQQVWADRAVALERLAAQIRGGTYERLANLLCEIAVRGGYGTEQMPNQLTQTQLADITGQTNVNVSRVFDYLERLGLIARANRQIIFKDWEGLCRFGGFSAPMPKH